MSQSTGMQAPLAPTVRDCAPSKQGKEQHRIGEKRLALLATLMRRAVWGIGGSPVHSECEKILAGGEDSRDRHALDFALAIHGLFTVNAQNVHR